MLRYSRLVGALPAVVPFVPPEAFERQLGRPIAVRIGANESAFGPSPKAVAAIREGATRVNWYCDPEGYVLREALARHHGVTRDQIGLGAGADDLLGLVVRAVIDPGDPVVMSHGAYPTFAFHVNGFGGRFVTPPYRSFRNDAAALADAAQNSGARLVYLSNPDNPTGSWLAAAEQLAILKKLPAGSLLVLDEAYSDFAPEGSLPAIDPEDPRVIRIRTFSKAHGMAGARVGYAIGARGLIAAFDKIRHHFGVTRLSQEAALATRGDPDFISTRATRSSCRTALIRPSPFM
jgi:histidinol-phosphate aminotransferase